MRFFVAGFQHETNTFAASKADWSDFERGDFFPPVSRGPEMLRRLRAAGLPMSGFLKACVEGGHEPVASCWAGASPSGPVTSETFERILELILADLDACLEGPGADGIYLDLHGAAVGEHLASLDLRLVERLRSAAGPDLPLVASLDLHANVDPAMLAHADYVTAYRTYPHVDMEETGRRAHELLVRRVAAGSREPHAFVRLPFLIPIVTQNTSKEPARSVYADLEAAELSTGVRASFCPGFPAADVPNCGPTLWAYGPEATSVVDALRRRIIDLGAAWRPELPDAEEAVAEALARVTTAAAPCVIADVQDNPGAGADGSTTGLLRALLLAGAGRLHPRKVALGLMFDAEAAARASSAGVGARIEVDLGRSARTWSGEAGDPPVRATCEVLSLHDGEVVLPGAMMGGAVVDPGRCACLDVEGILVVVSSARTQLLDQALYRMVGIDPASMRILVNKSAVHFHADFDPIASSVIYARSPGTMAADPADLPWRNLPGDMRTRIGAA